MERAHAEDPVAPRTLRIAAHISASEWGGAERRSLVLLAALAARGHHVRVFCNTDFIAARARDSGLEAEISPLRGDIMLHHAAQLARRLRAFRPDSLILVTFRRLLPGALAARLAGVPHVVARVGLASDVARSAKYRFVLKHWIDDVVVNAESLIAPFMASLPERARVHVTAIPNGVEPRAASLSRADARTAFHLPQHAFVIGTVARLVRQKRIDRVVRIVHALRESHVHALVAGDGYARDDIVALARDLGVEDRVHLPGHREDAGNVHRALDLYLVTSDQEGMSSGMLEALAAGLPVVSTPVSGAREVLASGQECGLVIPADDQALAAAVSGLMIERSRLDLMGIAARQVAEERYGIEAMVERWEVLLKSRTR